MKYEAKVARYLNHPSVTTYVGLFVEEGRLKDKLADLYLVSDFVNQGHARAYLAANRRRDVAEKLVRQHKREREHS